MSTPVERLTRRTALVGAACLATGGAAMAFTPRRHESSIGRTKLADIVPDRAGLWSTAPAADMVLPDAAQPGSFYDQVLTRTYRAAGAPPVMLLVAYGAAQSGLMKVHRPEVCYGSAGYTIRNFHHVPLDLGLPRPVDAAAFRGWREDRSEEVLYWTRISDVFPRSLLQQRLVMFERGLAGMIPDGVLVRCSVMNPSPGGAAGALHDFARALVAGASPTGRALLIGTRLPPSPRTGRLGGALPLT